MHKNHPFSMSFEIADVFHGGFWDSSGRLLYRPVTKILFFPPGVPGICANVTVMATVVERKLREAERQDELLKTTLNAVRELSEDRLIRVFRVVNHLIETGDTNTAPSEEDGETGIPDERESRAVRKRRNSNGHGSYTDQSEALVLAQKRGMTAREVAAATGQKSASADGTLRYIANSRKTIESRSDGKWYPIANAKVHGRKVGVREAVVLAYEKNGNAPWATRDVFAGVQAILPDVKRGTIDKTLVGMRADGILVSCGSDPKGVGGLYKLPPFLGATVA